MANLNLSEFGEKLFVADADHTFIWDTVGAISKRVSRNSWLNSGTLTSDAPVTISQTWGNNLATFKALVVNAAGTSGTNSASGSLLADFQLAGVSQLSVTKAGSLVGKTETNLFSQNAVNINGSLYSSNIIGIGNNLLLNLANVSVGISLASDYPISWSSNAGSTNYSALNTVDVQLRRDAANTLALRNGTNAQTFNVYGTYTSGSAYARLAIACDTSGNATLTTQSTGTAGTVSINGVPVGLGKGNVSTNVAIGVSALNANTTGSRNIAIGNESLLSVTTGLANTAIGAGALRAAATGSIANSAIGDLALTYCATSTYNTAIGQGAGTFVLSGSTLSSSSYSVFIGTDTKANSNGETNQIVIGHLAQGLGSNSVVLGNASITTTALRGNVGIGTTAPSSKLHVNGAIIQKPDASATPPANGDLVVEATSNTTLTFKLKGTDGTVRSGTITLA